MKRLLLLLLLLSVISVAAPAQKNKAPDKPAGAKKAAVPTEEDMRKAYRSGDYAGAVRIADQILVKKPGDQRTLVVKAMSYGMMGNKEMALKTADALYPHSKDTEANFIAVLPLNLSHDVIRRDAAWYIAEGHRLSPNSAVVYMIESSVYADDSAFDKAGAAARKGISLLNDTYTTGVQAQLAFLLHMSGGKEEAYKLINSINAKYPKDSNILTTNYSMLIRDKRYPEALSILNGLVIQFPAEPRLRKERAFLFEDMDRHGDACNEALTLSEQNDTYFGLLRRLGCPQAFANLNPAQVKAYNYDVDYHGAKYQFIVTPKSIKMDAGASFDWRMTLSNEKKGSISISKAALDTAHGQMNTFSGGPGNLTNLTSVWVSNAVYRELKHNGKSIITATDAGPKTFNVLPDEDDEATVQNASGHTKAVKTLHARSEDGQEELWINDDANNPLITRMSLGWSIDLRSIE
jgi:Flp pilus assembly protein TadD